MSASAILMLLATMAAVGDAAPKKVDKTAVRIMESYSACVATHRSAAKKIFSTVPDSPEELKLTLHLSIAECLKNGGQLKFRPRIFRAIVAQRLYQLQRTRPIAMVPVFAAIPVANAASAEQKVSLAFVSYGECVAAANLVGTQALLDTKTDSEDEKAAFIAIQPAMSGCAAPGVSFRMNRLQMRGYLAEGAYRNEALAKSGAAQ